MISKRQLQRVFTPLTGDPAPRISDTLSGNINTILKVEARGRAYGLRIRTQESVYRYEADLIKEIFISWLLDPEHAGTSDADKAQTLALLHAERRGPGFKRGGIEPAGRAYDCSRAIIPHPYFVYEWIDGTPLWNTPSPDAYATAGAALARLHRVRFEAVYADFFGIGKTPLRWSERFRAAVDKERREAADRRLDSSLVRAVEQLALPPEPSTDPNLAPCLVHNDFAPGNILMHHGRLAAVIDWDNAVVDLPPLDFVKMKYWTVRDADGRLAHDAKRFHAFAAGYGERGAALAETRCFACYELLWLLRVFNFETSKQARGLSPAPGYPPADHYARALVEVLDRLHAGRVSA